ncbi:hypothetical protein EIN_491020 [Entamoeba invadens IP1]|uniref:Uncharacterized protein n=1 Tax=Entamoeba invadens IP1 TaxID=370355 RepID=A0A0A1U3Y5_ENTIV|nr:hypothetical protein EIN_491020 [Entamoeba invadens IP1]ELP88953.1 hypothetical protein EIN_491020 [Entamoeba invadens IP1]|eukprot:XP_004255724.1 hypothetical protein EIN_491020 [Entamoeba invadens IP1]
MILIALLLTTTLSVLCESEMTFSEQHDLVIEGSLSCQLILSNCDCQVTGSATFLNLDNSNVGALNGDFQVVKAQNSSLKITGIKNTLLFGDNSTQSPPYVKLNILELTKTTINSVNSTQEGEVIIDKWIDHDANEVKHLGDFPIFTIKSVQIFSGNLALKTYSSTLTTVESCAPSFCKTVKNSFFITTDSTQLALFKNEIECVTYGTPSDIYFGTKNLTRNMCPCNDGSDICAITLTIYGKIFDQTVLQPFHTKHKLNIIGTTFSQLDYYDNITVLSLKAGGVIQTLQNIQIEEMYLNGGVISNDVVNVTTNKLYGIQGQFAKKVSNCTLGDVVFQYMFLADFELIKADNFISQHQISTLVNFYNLSVTHTLSLEDPIVVNQQNTFGNVSNVDCNTFVVKNVMVYNNFEMIKANALTMENTGIFYVGEIVADEVVINKHTGYVIANVTARLLNITEFDKPVGYRYNFLEFTDADTINVNDSLIYFVSSTYFKKGYFTNSEIRQFTSTYAEKMTANNLWYYESDSTLISAIVFFRGELGQVIVTNTTEVFLEVVEIEDLQHEGKVVLTEIDTVHVGSINSPSDVEIENTLHVDSVSARGTIIFDNSINTTVSATSCVFVVGTFSIKMNSATRITLIEKTVSLLLETLNSPTLTFMSLKCNSSIHVSPLDYLPPKFVVVKIEDNCAARVLIDFNIPFYSSGAVISGGKIACNQMAFTTDDYIEEFETTKMPFPTWAYKNNNKCLPKKCLLGGVGGGVFFCSNGESCTKNCDVVLTDQIVSMSCGIQDMYLSTNVQKMVLSASCAVSDIYIGENALTIFTGENYIMCNSFEGNGGIDVNVHAAVNCEKVHLDSVRLRVFGTMKGKELNTTTISMTADSRIEYTTLNVDNMKLENECEYSTSDPLISCDNINSEKIMFDIPECYKTVESLELIIVRKGIRFNTEGEVVIACEMFVVVTNGTNGIGNVRCSKFGISKYCYLVGETVADSVSYDYTKSTHTTCPCVSDEFYGCSYIIDSPSVLVSGDINAFEVVIKQCNVLKGDTFNVSVQLTAQDSFSLDANTIIVNRLWINKGVNMSMNGNAEITLINGFGKMTQTGVMRVKDLFTIELHPEKLNGTKTINPGILYLDNSLIQLEEKSIFYLNNSKVVYTTQKTTPIVSYGANIIGIVKTTVVDFPEHTCTVFLEMKSNPILYFSGELISPENDYKMERTCHGKTIIFCNSPAEVYQCPSETCYYVNQDKAVDSSEGYNTTECPCGFTDGNLIYSDNGCIISALGTQSVTGLYGTFRDFIVENGTELITRKEVVITQFQPKAEMSFKGVGKVTINVKTAFMDMFTITNEVELNIGHIYGSCEITSNNNISLAEVDNFLKLTVSGSDVHFTKRNVKTLELITSNSSIVLDDGIACDSFNVTTNGFVSPLMNMPEGSTFVCSTFDYKGNDSGMLLESIRDSILIEKLVSGYIDDEKSFLSTEKMTRSHTYCKLEDGVWNSTKCPCSGDSCHIILLNGEQDVINSFNVKEMKIIGGKHHMKGEVRSESIYIDGDVIFTDIKCNNFTMNESTDCDIILEKYEISKMKGKAFSVTSNNEGTITQIEGNLVRLYIKNKIQTKYVNINNLHLHQSHTNQVMIDIENENGLFVVDTSYIYLFEPLENKYFLIKSPVIPILDTIHLYKLSEANSLSEVEDMYLTVICKNYLALLADVNDGECPMDDSSDANHLIWLVVIPAFLVVVLLLLAAVFLSFKLRKYIANKRQFHRLF